MFQDAGFIFEWADMGAIRYTWGISKLKGSWGELMPMTVGRLSELRSSARGEIERKFSLCCLKPRCALFR